MEVKNTKIKNFKIRNVGIDDMEDLAKLYFQFWNEESDVEKMRAKFMRLQDNGAYIILCAVEENQVIGSVMGIVCDELYGECEPFLVVENMIVDNQHYKKGVGKMLFAELEKQAIAKGCAQVILVTDEDRKGAQKFYESLGFPPNKNKGYKKKLISVGN